MYFSRKTDTERINEIESPVLTAFPQLQDMLRQVFSEPPPVALVVNTGLSDDGPHQASLEHAFEIFLPQSIICDDTLSNREQTKTVFLTLGIQLLKMTYLAQRFPHF